MARYDEKVDIYSLGVTLFVLLTSSHPYTDPTENVDDERIWRERKLAGYVRWPAVDRCLSPAGQDLVRFILTRNPILRFTAAQCLGHCWFDPIRGEVARVFGDGSLAALKRTVP